MIDQQRIEANKDKVLAIVEKYNSGDATGKINAVVELGALSNKLHLANDTMCIFCGKAQDFMQEVIRYFAQPIQQKKLQKAKKEAEAPREFYNTDEA